jgi:hypothetical protein
MTYDPHRAHDFDVVEAGGHRVFWKIDYAAASCEYGSEDPADPSRTTHLLTIFFGHEH